MRVIGKGSLASLLAVGLHAGRVVLWIALVTLGIAMLLTPFASQISDFLQNAEGFEMDRAPRYGAGKFLRIAYPFVATAVMLFVTNRLLEVLKTLRFGSPFVMENANAFRAVGYALLIGEGARLAFRFLTMLKRADVDIHLSLPSWFAIVAVFVLAEVFHEGARMKEEQDLTV
jgi:hypothetical protein